MKKERRNWSPSRIARTGPLNVDHVRVETPHSDFFFIFSIFCFFVARSVATPTNQSFRVCKVGPVEQRDPLTEVQGWKLFGLLPFWLLRKPPSQGQVEKSELSERFEAFTRGHWGALLFSGDQGRVAEPCSRGIRASDT